MSARPALWHLWFGLFLLFCSLPPRIGAASLPAEYAPDEIVLEITSPGDASAFPWDRYGLALMSRVGNHPFYRARILDGTTPPQKRDQLLRDASTWGVGRVEPNFIGHGTAYYTPQAFPNDTYYAGGTYQFNVWRTQYDLALNETIGGMRDWILNNASPVTVADLNTGVLSTHEDLAGRLLTGWNVLTSTTNTTDSQGHGTWTMGILGATINNAKGVAGFSGNNWMFQVKIDNNNIYYNTDLIAAIDWASTHGAKVLNISQGGDDSSLLHTSCDDAYNTQHCVLVASSGNTGTNVTQYPGGYTSSVINVGATDELDQYTSYSTYNNSVALSATSGSQSLAIYPATTGITSNASYATIYGTSFAAPIVSGLCALLVSNGVAYNECLARMARTADKVDPTAHPYATDAAHPLGTWNDHLGYGRINFYRCLKTLVPPTLVSVTPGAGGATLVFSAPALADTATYGYNVYRASSAGGPYTRINTQAATGTSFIDTGASSGQTWYYVVTALDSNPEHFETKMSNELSIGGVSSTPTATPSYSPTPVPTWTATLTSTASFSPTSTPTSSSTATPSKTSTPSSTPTGTPTASATSTASPTASPTASFTSTRSTTATPTFTTTSTSTASPVYTFTPTPSSTATYTATATVTPTASSISSPTALSTSTITSTFSSTPTYTATSQATPTASSTSTPDPVFSPTATHTATATGSYTSTPSATATVSSTPSITATRTATVLPTETFSPTAAMTAQAGCGPLSVSNPFPNPATHSDVFLLLGSACPLSVEWSVVTVADRAIVSGQATAPATVVWDRLDAKGRPVASGLYYFVVRVGNKEKTIRPVLILH